MSDTTETPETDIDLSVEGIDPITFQIIKHRLEQVTDEAVEALKRVSGAPNTNEGHDLMVALYTRDGALLTGGVGFLHHYLGASEATKKIIDRFEGDIQEGDVFILNDPYTAALHPPDVYIISPIFFDGELQAFSASFVHVADIGAIDPGGFSPNSTSVYHEGFQTPGMKLIEGGEMRQDVLDTILNMSRDPGMVELDLRSEIAANNVAKDRLTELMEEYSADTVERVGRELIDQSEKKFRKRLLELPDGRWEERQYLDSQAEDEMYTVQLALEKEGDSLTFDFEGTSGESKYGMNCTYIATVGGVMAPLFPLMCHDMTWNDGIIKVVDVDAPSGTIVNAERPAPISIATVGTLQMCNSLSTLAVSKLLGSHDSYADRATGVWHGAHAHVSIEIGREEGTHVEALTDTFAGSGGARAFDDGVDLGGEVVNIVARWGNVERHEAVLPLCYLNRQYVSDSGGPGEYRGGVGHEYAVTPVPSADFEHIDVVTMGRGVDLPHSTGVFGGYPGSNIEYALHEDAELWGRDSDESFPPERDEMPESRGMQWGVTPLEEDDVFYLRFAGSGGYGDPLKRDPDDVGSDVADGVIDQETASTVYGLDVDVDSGEIVEDNRNSSREERLEKADSPSETIEDVETTPTDNYLSADLRVVTGDDGTPYASCGDCGTLLARADEDWKEGAAVLESPVARTGVHTEGPEDYCLREFLCPDCGTLHDTEVSERDDHHLISRLSP
ncbi:hydantoinase B/oxoprolinase family protein [Natrarchaeobius chitinivorans]|uniref:Hydantoinase B/oxoprolinase family protein n=1 Tax=Natrarchaeobius chitinivorans TaxID=1679083 RepID=A0A3N6PD84_NATCH|nr:hydantoinase B/oxoprolinase family protein [Natrarchaeobius chitinivorans]RQG94905.1 hydantoinase B/oxoprolinase family protein [Natrarchaeobius chitinivorans]